MDSTRVLTQVEVTGLLGRFTHTVGFPATDEFVIVHGPNGVGKTMLLDLLSALAWPVDLVKLARVPFHVLRLTFSDGAVFTARKLAEVDPASHRPWNDTTGVVELELPLLLALQSGPGAERLDWSPQLLSGRLSGIAVARNSRWRHQALTDRERLLRDRVVHNPSDVGVWRTLIELDADLPDDLRDVMTESMPEPMRKFLASITVHSIDTHRLLGLSATDERTARPRRSVATKVEEFAQDLARRLAKELAENSRTSQELDRTYPQRLLENPVADVSEQAIRERYDAQNELRRQLGDIALVDDRTSAIEIPERMADWQRAVLWTYLRDTEDKLATFRDILARVSRLRDIVNSRFLFKHLEIDREQGFRLVSDDGRELDLASLSSGEQHELVLVYDLLFNVPSGALVLIDEPEISLHVSWQKGFIDDLRKIAELVRFRTVVATHSPQIAGKWADRMVVLGPAAE